MHSPASIRYTLLFLVLLAGACAPAERVARRPGEVAALPAVPRVRGALDIDVAYPPPNAARPNVDSTFIFGTVGTGDATLSINGDPVPVAANGAFLAYLPVPEDGAYHLAARTGRRTETFTRAYRPPPPPAATPPVTPPATPPRQDPPAAPAGTTFEMPRLGQVATGKDTLASGSEIAYGTPAPGADRQWFFPRGTRLTVVGRRGGLYQVRLGGDVVAFVDTASVTLSGPAPAESEGLADVRLRSAPRYVDVRLPAGGAPFLIDPEVTRVGITVYGRGAAGRAPDVSTDAFVTRAAWQPAAADRAHLVLDLAGPLWGFKAFYEADGTLVVRLRKPPAIDPANPLRGIRVLIDPGHPPGGAIGPTGLTEAVANLAISRRVAERLRARGADVLLTRATGDGIVSNTNTAQELWARVDTAVALDADLLVSIHNNAFPDGVNPFLSFGTETYYYHPFSEGLASALVRELVPVTGLPNLGAKQRSLALIRPSWMPSTLTESLFMMFPQQEAALRDPAFLDRLAAAHVAGITAFLKARATHTARP